MKKKDIKKEKTKKNTSPKKTPVAEAIDEYLENNDYNETFQSLQPFYIPTLKHNYKKPSNEVLKKAFYQWRGNKTYIARGLGVSRPTVDDWIKSDTELQKAYDDSLEMTIDHAESKLFELMDGVLVQDYDFKGKPVVYKSKPDIKALNTFLFSRAKDRGYVQRTEADVNQKISGNLGFSNTIKNLSDEDLEKELKKLDDK